MAPCVRQSGASKRAYWSLMTGTRRAKREHGTSRARTAAMRPPGNPHPKRSASPPTRCAAPGFIQVSVITVSVIKVSVITVSVIKVSVSLRRAGLRQPLRQHRSLSRQPLGPRRSAARRAHDAQMRPAAPLRPQVLGSGMHAHLQPVARNARPKPARVVGTP